MRVTLLLLLVVFYTQCRSISETGTATVETSVKEGDSVQKKVVKIAPKISENEKTTSGGGSMWSNLKDTVSGVVDSAMDGASRLTGYVSKLFRRSDDDKGTTPETTPARVQERELRESDIEPSNSNLKEETNTPVDDVHEPKSPQEQPPISDLEGEIDTPMSGSDDAKPVEDDSEQKEDKDVLLEKGDTVVKKKDAAEEETSEREMRKAEDLSSEDNEESEEESRRVKRTDQRKRLYEERTPRVILKGDEFDIPDLT